MHNNPLDKDLCNAENKAIELFYLCQRKMESVCKQKAKEKKDQTWGTLMTISFSDFQKQRQYNNKISTIMEADGVLIKDYNSLIDHFVTLCRNFLREPTLTFEDIQDEIISMGPCLDISQQLTLMKPFYKLEVKTVIFSIPAHKSPSPNGYNRGFFKGTWDITRANITKAILAFFEYDAMLRE